MREATSIEDEVRPGLAGSWDRFAGPRPSTVETFGTVASALAGAVFGDAGLEPKSPVWQRAALKLLALDVWGGVWTNNTPACVRWYERPGQGVKEHLGFAAIHAIHPATVAGVDVAAGNRSADSATRWALGHYAWMLASATAIVSAPRRIRLPIATAASAIGLGLDRKAGASRSTPWFAPAYYAKLLIGHAAGSIWNLNRDPGMSHDGRA